MNSNKRMAVNTLILYAKLIITIIVNLYSTRLILNAMGVEDYGVVNLISGIVAMLSFVQNSMSVSTQRYMSVSMGKKNDILVHKVFCNSYILHIILAMLIIAVLECLIPVVFDSSIQIPESRVSAAQILYQLTIISTILVVITVPFDAALNARENMLLYSIATIIESIIRLVGALILLVYLKDKLIFYGCLEIAIRFVSMIIKRMYCRLNYKETHFSVAFYDFNVLKDMFSFAFWNMFGSLSIAARSQGTAIVMNTFLGVAINAAYGIANQVSGQLQNFTATISKAMTPQIMQRAGAGDKEGMISLSIKQCKYASFLLAYAIIPLLFSMPLILRIWLKDVPEYSIEFCSLMLIVSMVQQSTNGIMSLVQATGKIRNYQVAVSVIMLLNIPIAYYLLQKGLSAPFVLVGMIVIEAATCIVRLLFANKLTGLSMIFFTKEVLIPLFVVYIFSCVPIKILANIWFGEYSTLTSFIVLSCLAVFLITISVFCVLSKTEKDYIIAFVKNRIIRIK